MINQIKENISTVSVLTKGSYSLACGKVMPVNEGDKVSVYISHPVPCR